MLRTRLLMGSILSAFVIGMLLLDEHIVNYPIQLAFQIALACLASREMFLLLGPSRPVQWEVAVCGVLAMNIVPSFVGDGTWDKFGLILRTETLWRYNGTTWAVLLGFVVFFQLAICLRELCLFEKPGESFERMAQTWMVIAYLGLMPSFFGQARFLYPWGSPIGTTAVALLIFVPKGCDIGAYFTGRLFGKHRMAPVLSPKKTWEGAIGGLVLAAGFAVAIDRLAPASALGENLVAEIAFGITVGLVGMLGDLAESLIKRDCQQKDASQTVPGFGGVLDVIDSVIFAAPVAYVWLLAMRPAV